MRLVLIESPYAGDRERNIAYALLAMKDSLDRGEAPYLSHLLYTQVYDDNDQRLRSIGIEAGLAWGAKSEATICYVDHGISGGMQHGIDRARKEGRPVEYRAFTREGAERAHACAKIETTHIQTTLSI